MTIGIFSVLIYILESIPVRQYVCTADSSADTVHMFFNRFHCDCAEPD